MSSFLFKIKKMTLEEKLQTMELLWDDLRENIDGVDFPKWHQDVLDEREQMQRQNVLHYTDWAKAKKDIEKKVNENKDSRFSQK